MPRLMSCAQIPEYKVVTCASPDAKVTTSIYLFDRGGSLTVSAQKRLLPYDGVWGGSVESFIEMVPPPPIPSSPPFPHKCCSKLIDIIDDSTVWIADSVPKITVRGVNIPDPEIADSVPARDRFSIVLMGETISFCPFCGSRIDFEERGE